MAVRVGDRALTYAELAGAAGGVAVRLLPGSRVAVVADASLEAIVAIIGALAAGCAVVPLNPSAGDRERTHVLDDCRPTTVLAGSDIDLGCRAELPTPPRPSAPALVVYTSGTTGLPKGAVLSHAAVAACIDGLADTWDWDARDTVVHALPIYHVHGLVLGTLGPLRVGGVSHHVGGFSPSALGAAVEAGGTIVFGVPTMWSRIAAAAEDDPALAARFANARLLVSGSAGLPLSVHHRLHRVLGRRVLERYGMTETLITTAEPLTDPGEPGSVGRAIRGVSLRLVDDDGGVITASDGEVLGGVELRAASMFDGYLDQPEATENAVTPDGWFRTGDIATRRPDGSIRIVGRRSSDLIKSAGYRIGAGEIETILLDHPAVADVAVAGVADDDLGERVVAWVVVRRPVGSDELIAHVARSLAPHKRPREVRFVDALPRNALGKVLKRELR